MTNLKTNTARAALIALIAAAPMTAFAAVEVGTPQQAVDADPDEYVAPQAATGNSLEDTPKAAQGNAYEDSDIVEDVQGSIYEGDAKADG